MAQVSRPEEVAVSLSRAASRLVWLAEEVCCLLELVQVKLPLGGQRRELDARVQTLELLQQLLKQRLQQQQQGQQGQQ